MTAEAAPRSPHPLVYDVGFPGELSRPSTAFRYILALPQLFVVGALGYVLQLMSIAGWFSVLFTGHYPRSMHTFGVGILRWHANVYSYLYLLRDEYPPWTTDAGLYPVTLWLPYEEQQSRWRLLIRGFAWFPNQFVLSLLTFVALFTGIYTWFAILFTGRYPKGTFQFHAGLTHWQLRLMSYQYVLTDRFPPYSRKPTAPPGNEVISAVLGLPFVAAYIGLQVLYFAFVFGGGFGGDTTTVNATLLDEPGGIERTRPSLQAGSLRVTLTGYTPTATCEGIDVYDSPFVYDCYHFDIEARKEGFLPALYTPYFFSVDTCGEDYESGVDPISGDEFEVFWRDGTVESRIRFSALTPDARPCSLTYFTPYGPLEFEFR